MSDLSRPPRQARIALSRRAFLAGAAVLAANAAPRRAGAAQPTGPQPPGSWRPWFLTSGDGARPLPPASPSADELAEVRSLQAKRTTGVAMAVEKWSTAPAILPWTNLALDLIEMHQPSPVRAARALALLHTALADTTIAVWDARAAYPRPAPAALDAAIVPLGDPVAANTAFPSEHAAIAATAAPLLAYLFPDEPAAGLDALANDAAMSRLWAGTNVRSDIAAGQAIGRAVADRAIARGKADGSAKSWDGQSRPTAPGVWQPTPPAYIQQPTDPLAGRWTPWVLASGSQFRAPTPPAYRSPAWQAEVIAVQEAVRRRTPKQTAAAPWWAGGAGTTTPAGLWTVIARGLIVRDGFDLPHAARALALTTAAMADASICCWDAKFAYWTERPITADPTLAVLFPTPPFPSYTSGHATLSAAAATVLGHLFPNDQDGLAAQAMEAAASRIWAGIHFPIDSDVGMAGGREVGRLVVARAVGDGAE
ncbi:MAG TPA: phosphatase PAP2 family protein [Thermomicrobiales bacterium]|nr:phosphatase PAP2 family protein [Thermomicrobiales bacterium]